jgi:hypothetical protein
MLSRSFLRTLILVCWALLLLSGCVFGASLLTADQYFAVRRSIPLVSNVSSIGSDFSHYIGKTVELSGKVSGTMKCDGTESLLLISPTDSYLIKTPGGIPSNMLMGTNQRVLAKIGPGCTSSLSDLTLRAIASEEEVSQREEQLAAKAKAAPDRGTYRLTYSSSGSTRGIALSSRAMQVYNPYHAAIAKFNPRLTSAEVDTITASILSYSEQYGVDPRLVIALIIAESNFKPSAISHSGAMGLCQLMPRTARGMGVDNAFDPEQSIAASIRLIRGHLDKFGDLELALSAYNAGAGAVKRHGGVPPYKETRNYIAKITRIYKALCGIK